jgi:putative Holliday junction resolvase
MRYLAIDLGDKRTGIASGDDETGFIAPLEVLETPRGPLLLDAVIMAISKHAPQAIVLGLPLNMDGTEGPATKIVREFGSAIAARCSLPIHYQDERLTSHAAEQHLNQSRRTHKQKKELRDALAAVEILRDYLDNTNRSTNG